MKMFHKNHDDIEEFFVVKFVTNFIYLSKNTFIIMVTKNECTLQVKIY